ncbi:MAG TPA: FlgD immunoglobulin-like domain containing protein [Stellaceae bacterium]|nr:FlgD immunoglobulin-like domain containing protein [Stellaceae bacterium]
MTAAASVMPATVTTLPVGTQLQNAANTPSAANGPNTTLNENDFLKLLTTQLEKQNPLNPQNPSDLAAELAQFSTASGVQTLNQTLGTGGGVQAAGLVGKNVAVAGNALILGAGGTAQGAFNLSAAASDVKLAIADASGSIVDVVDLGAVAAGSQNFSWNGQGLDGKALPAGTYSYSIKATAASSAATVTATPYAVVPVTSVVLGGQNGTMLDLGGGLAPVALSAVQEVF